MYSKRVKILLLFVTAVILATVVILQFLYQVKSNSEGKRIVQAIKNSKQIIPSWEHNKARVTITEFGNYLCSHCKQFDRDIVSRLEKDFKNNPQVQFQYIDVPFSNEISNINSNVSQKLYTLNKNKYWDLHHKIYTIAPKASKLNNKAIAHYQRQLIALIEQLNLDESTSRLVKEMTMETKSNVYNHGLAQQLNIDHVPVLYINQQRSDNIRDYKALKKEIIKALN